MYKMKKFTLIIQEKFKNYNSFSNLNKTLIELVHNNKITFNCFPGIDIYTYESDKTIDECVYLIDQLGFNYLIFDTTVQTDNFRLNGYTDFIDTYLGNSEEFYEYTLSNDEEKEKILIKKSKEKGPESLTTEEKIFLENRLK